MLDYDNFTNKEISLCKSCHESNQLYSHRLGSIWNRSIFLLDLESTKKREYGIACCRVMREISYQALVIPSKGAKSIAIPEKITIQYF